MIYDLFVCGCVCVRVVLSTVVISFLSLIPGIHTTCDTVRYMIFNQFRKRTVNQDNKVVCASNLVSRVCVTWALNTRLCVDDLCPLVRIPTELHHITKVAVYGPRKNLCELVENRSLPCVWVTSKCNIMGEMRGETKGSPGSQRVVRG